MVIKSIKDNLFKIFGSKSQDAEYIELDLGEEVEKSKVIVKPFVLRKFEDVNNILNTLRQGYTIAIIDIKPLKSKDIIELKRAVSKIKKTADAIEGTVAGFGENIIIATPQFATIYRQEAPKPKPQQEFEAY